jgi:hypothetical protein
MSELYQSLSHSKWDCKYHVVFVPNRRRKVIFGQTRCRIHPNSDKRVKGRRFLWRRFCRQRHCCQGPSIAHQATRLAGGV